jgi:hypothetical protein
MPILSTAAAGSLLLPQTDLDAVMDFVSTALRQAEGSAAPGVGVMIGSGHRGSASELPSFQQRLGSPRGADGDRLSAGHGYSRAGLDSQSGWAVTQDRASAGWGMGGASSTLWASPPRGSMSGAYNQGVTSQPPPLVDLNDLSLLVDLAELIGTLLRCIQPHAARVVELLFKSGPQQSLSSILRGLQDPITGRISAAGGPGSTPLAVLPEVKERDELGSEPATETGPATAVGSEGGSEGQSQPGRNPWSPDSATGGGLSTINDGRRSSSGGGAGGTAAVLQAAVTAHLHQLLELEWALVCRNHVAALLQRVRELTLAQSSAAAAAQQAGSALRHVDSWRDRMAGSGDPAGVPPSGAGLGVAGLVARSGLSVTYSAGSVSRGRLGSTLNSNSGGGTTAAAQQAAQALEAAELLLLQWTTALVAADTFHAETELQASVVSVITTVSGAGLSPVAVVELDTALRSRNIFNAKLAEQMTRLKAATRGNSTSSIPKVGATISEGADAATKDGSGHVGTPGVSSPTRSAAVAGLDSTAAAGRKPSVTAPVVILGGHAVMAPDAMRAQIAQATLALLREYAGISSATHTSTGGSSDSAAALQLHPQQQQTSRASVATVAAAGKPAGAGTAPGSGPASGPGSPTSAHETKTMPGVTFLITPSAGQAGSTSGQYRGMGSSTPSLRRVGALGIDRPHDSKVALEELRCTSLLQCTLTIVGAHPRQFAHSSRRGFKSVHSDLCMCFKNPFSAPAGAVRAARAQAATGATGADEAAQAGDRGSSNSRDRLTFGAPGSASMSAAATRAQHHTMLQSASARVPSGTTFGASAHSFDDSMQDSGDSMGDLGQGGVFIADPQEELKALMTIPLWDTAGARGSAVALEKRTSRGGQQRPSQPGNIRLGNPAPDAVDPTHAGATVANTASSLSSGAPNRLASVAESDAAAGAGTAAVPAPGRALRSDSIDSDSSDGRELHVAQQSGKEAGLQGQEQDDAAQSSGDGKGRLSTLEPASVAADRASSQEPAISTQAAVTDVVAEVTTLPAASPSEGDANTVTDDSHSPAAQVAGLGVQTGVPPEDSAAMPAMLASPAEEVEQHQMLQEQVAASARIQEEQEHVSANIQRSIADMVAEALGSDHNPTVDTPLHRPRSADHLQGSVTASLQSLRGQVVGLGGSGLERLSKGVNSSTVKAAWADAAGVPDQQGRVLVAGEAGLQTLEQKGAAGGVLYQTMTPDVVSEEEGVDDDPYTNPLLKKQNPHQHQHYQQQVGQGQRKEGTEAGPEGLPSLLKLLQKGSSEDAFLNPIASITIPTSVTAAAAYPLQHSAASASHPYSLRPTSSAPSTPFAAGGSSHHTPFQHKHYNPLHQTLQQQQQRKSTSRPPGMPTTPPSTRSTAGSASRGFASGVTHGRASISVASPSRPSSRTLTTQTSAPAGTTSIHRATWVVPVEDGTSHAAPAARSPAARKAHVTATGRAAASTASSPAASPVSAKARPRPRTAEKPKRNSGVSHTESEGVGVRLSEFLRSAASSTSMQASPLASPPINRHMPNTASAADSPGAADSRHSSRAATGAAKGGTSSTVRAPASTTHPARSSPNGYAQTAAPYTAGTTGISTAARATPYQALGGTPPEVLKQRSVSRSLYFNAIALEEDAPPSHTDLVHPSIENRVSNSPEPEDSTGDPLAAPIDGVTVLTSTFTVGTNPDASSGATAVNDVVSGTYDADNKTKAGGSAYARRSLDKLSTYPRAQSPSALLNPLFVQSRRLRQSQSHGHNTP